MQKIGLCLVLTFIKLAPSGPPLFLVPGRLTDKDTAWPRSSRLKKHFHCVSVTTYPFSRLFSSCFCLLLPSVVSMTLSLSDIMVVSKEREKKRNLPGVKSAFFCPQVSSPHYRLTWKTGLLFVEVIQTILQRSKRRNFSTSVL